MTLADAVRKAKRVYIVGNGGSFANAAHICNDLLSVGVRAFTLDSATLTAWANDYGYEQVFSRWIKTVGEPGDLLVALSGSGQSDNILNACAVAHVVGMDIFRIFGNERGEQMQLAEERQIVLGHNAMVELKEDVCVSC
jgi:D-sedoheptulose 7-phosphate isomerase